MIYISLFDAVPTGPVQKMAAFGGDFLGELKLCLAPRACGADLLRNGQAPCDTGYPTLPHGALCLQ